MGRYTPMKNEYLKNPPTKQAGESDAAYKQRLRQWNIARNKGGSRIQTAGAPKPKTEKKESAGGWMDKVTRALGGK